jgi:hypothetical protein
MYSRSASKTTPHWVYGVTVMLLAMSAGASERSQVLVAKGELAYHRGNSAEARALLEQAVAADPSDANAHVTLGQVLLAAGDGAAAARAFERAAALDPESEAAQRGLVYAREGAPVVSIDGERVSGTVGEIGRIASVRSEAARRWGLTLTSGLQYDSNVTLEPHNRTGAGLGDKDDIAFVMSGGGHFDVVSRPELLFRLEYDLYQTLHPDLDDYDFRSQRIQGTISRAVHPNVWVGLQGGYNHYTLGPHSYLGEPFVMPFVSVLQGEWGLTQAQYRHGDNTYFSEPFNEVRDGPTESAGLRQDLFLDDDRYVSGGYQFTNEDPSPSAGSDYESNANEVYLGGGLPLVWETYLDVQYLYRNDHYVHRNSFANFRKKRQDDGHFFYAGVSRPIMPHVSVAVVYYGTINDSNVSVFDYQRHVVGTLLQVIY